MRLHSHFSLRYGIHSPEALIDWAHLAGYNYAILTDINHTGSALRFVEAAQQKGIRPVVGVELRLGMRYVASIIARNNRGFQELNAFLTRFLEAGPQQVLSELPHFSACYTWYPLANAPRKLKPNEYIEIQAHEIIQLKLNYKHIRPEKCVAVAPMSFLNQRDFNAHRLLRAIDQNCLLSMLPKSEEASAQERFQSAEAYKKAFEHAPELLERSENLLRTCQLHFAFEEAASPQNPATFTGSKEGDIELLKELCAEGLSYRYSTITDEIIARIEMEIEVIAEKNYLSYFLITWDFTSYARSKQYFYVGRGSGANSIVAYLLRITDVDPLELDLYFERFINLYRKNPPDFDIDFSWRERDDIVRYLFERYPNTAWLCTYNTFQFRAAVREIGKVFGLPKTEIDALCKAGKHAQARDQLGQLVLRYSQLIEGLPSHLSVHSGGIVISEKPMDWFSGRFLPPKGYPTTQFSMREAEAVGLYKFDILSQRGLGKIKDCFDYIRRNTNTDEIPDIHDIQALKADPKIKALLIQGRALGCFYVESPAMRMLLIKLKVQSYLELVAASSIIRPGVSQSGMMNQYILRHHHPEQRQQIHPLLLELMPETYGVMVYQEDVIKVAHFFAGLSLAEADVLRRGMSGKFRSRAEFQQVQKRFFENCQTRGHDKVFSEDLWRQIESFAGYAFSKGHSASYAVESYQSLYLKAHYPLAYLTACINNFGGYYRTEIYVHEARHYGACIEAPSLNEGAYECVLRQQRLILGFNLVHGIEESLVARILEERQRRGPFRELEDLLRRVHVPLEQLSLLIRIGALRDFSLSRKELLWQAHFLLNKSVPKNPNELFAVSKKSYQLPELYEHPLELAFEQFELLGFPLCSPFELLREPLPQAQLTVRDFSTSITRQIEVYAYLVSIKFSRTRKGELMYFGTFIDVNGDTLDTVHFPSAAKAYPFYGKGVYRIIGKLSVSYDYFSLEVEQQHKLPFADDVRLIDVD
ncbi:MAG: hypothetical protein RLZZ301_1253 [Bacteroidota bacterium]|jgi:DNA polymerase-3 subunit alpha